PPASPPATGIDFLIVSRTPSSGAKLRASSCAARTARLVSSVGTSSASAPITSTLNSPAGAELAASSSYSDTAWKTVASGWNPSGRGGPTLRARLILAGTRTRIRVGGRAATTLPTRVPPSGQPASDSAIRAKSAIPSCSPRTWGSIPARSSTALAAAEEPTSPDNAERSILRRCANAASITANTRSRGAVVGTGSRRSSATSPESTFGTGQNTLGATLPTRRADAYQASFSDGIP